MPTIDMKRDFAHVFAGPLGAHVRDVLRELFADLDSLSDLAPDEPALHAPDFALGGALGQLLTDLDKVEAPDRSEYEDALHRELLQVGHVLNRLKWSIQPSGKIYAGAADTMRISCSKSDCPNKRI